MNTHFTVTPKFATKMLEKALRLYTPSLSERPMAEFLADKCDDLGFEDIQIDEVGNIIAKKGSGSPRPNDAPGSAWVIMCYSPPRHAPPT